MKKCDYVCIIYSIVLLIFGFTDDSSKQQAFAKARQLDQAVRIAKVVSRPVQRGSWFQYASITGGTKVSTVSANQLVSAR